MTATLLWEHIVGRYRALVRSMLNVWEYIYICTYLQICGINHQHYNRTALYQDKCLQILFYSCLVTHTKPVSCFLMFFQAILLPHTHNLKKKPNAQYIYVSRSRRKQIPCHCVHKEISVSEPSCAWTHHPGVQSLRNGFLLPCYPSP